MTARDAERELIQRCAKQNRPTVLDLRTDCVSTSLPTGLSQWRLHTFPDRVAEVPAASAESCQFRGDAGTAKARQCQGPDTIERRVPISMPSKGIV